MNKNKIVTSLLATFLLFTMGFSVQAENNKPEQRALLPGANVVVTNLVDFVDTVMNAEVDKSITFSAGFDLNLLGGQSLSPTHGYKITIDFGGKKFSAGTVNFNSGEFVLKNINIDALQTGGVLGAAKFNFVGNSKVTVQGGVVKNINFDTSMLLNSSGATIINDVVFENIKNHRGAMQIYSGASNVTLNRVVFKSNENYALGYDGGAIEVENLTGNLTINNSLFEGNVTKTGGVGAGSRGGAIAVHYASATGKININNSYFKANRASEQVNDPTHLNRSDGGAISVFKPNAGFEMTIDGSTFDSNSAADDGGAILLESSGSTNKYNVTIKNSTFYNNKAESLGDIANFSGGAIQVYSYVKLDVQHSTFVNNHSHDASSNSKQTGAAIAGFIIGKDFSSSDTLYVGNYFVEQDGTIRSGGVSNNINKAGKNTDNGGNIGFDVNVASTATLENVFGLYPPVLNENYSNVKVGTGAYEIFLPTLPILSDQGSGTGIANMVNGDVSTPPVTAKDQRDRPYINDVGAVEIAWVRYDANGGTFSSLAQLTEFNGTKYYKGTNPTTYDSITFVGGVESIKAGSTLSITHTNPNLEFKGWSRTPTGVVDTSLNPGTLYDTLKGDITIYAVWDVKAPPVVDYTVNFESNGGSAVPPILNVALNSKISKPGDPTWTGYTFKGWYVDDVTFNTPWDFMNDQVTGNLTLYAKWEKDADPVPPTPLPPLPSTGVEKNPAFLYGSGLIAAGVCLILIQRIRKMLEANK